MTEGFEPFDSQGDVLDFAGSGGRLQAPFDRQPLPVSVLRVYKNSKLRLSRAGVAFTADSGHLDRMFRRAR